MVAYRKRAGVLWVHGGCLRHEQYTSLTIFEGEAYLKPARTAHSVYRDETNTREEEFSMLRLIVALLISIALVCTTGCETFKGFGRDMQKGGRAIEDAASK